MLDYNLATSAETGIKISIHREYGGQLNQRHYRSTWDIHHISNNLNV